MPYRIKSPVTGSRIGFRGGVLLIYGFLELIVGWAVITSPANPLRVFSAAPILVYALIWLIPGGIAVITSFFKGAVEAFGYGLSFIPFFLYSLGIIVSYWPEHQLQVAPALRAAAIYLAFVMMIRIIARWPEPGDINDEINKIILQKGEANADAGDDDAS